MKNKRKKFQKFLSDTKNFFISLFHGWRATVMILASAVTIFITLFLTIFLEGNALIAAHVFFAFSLVFLVYIISFLIYYRELIKTIIISWANKYELTRNLLELFGFNILLFELITFIITVAYGFFLAIIAIKNRSIWYGALAIYNSLLVIVRLTLFVSQHKKAKHHSTVKLWTSYEVEEEAERANKNSKIQELRSYRICGCLLLTLSIALSTAVIQRVVSGGSQSYSEILIYILAIYTFYKIIGSSIRFAKTRKHYDHYVQAYRNINLADAAVSVFALQAALFRQFGGGGEYYAPNAILGTAVCILIITIGIIMIVKGTKDLNKLTKSKEPSELINEL